MIAQDDIVIFLSIIFNFVFKRTILSILIPIKYDGIPRIQWQYPTGIFQHNRHGRGPFTVDNSRTPLRIIWSNDMQYTTMERRSSATWATFWWRWSALPLLGMSLWCSPVHRSNRRGDGLYQSWTTNHKYEFISILNLLFIIY